MNLGERLSDAGARLGVALQPVLRRVRPELGREIQARRGAVGELEAWARRRSPGPLVWLHGASAGELLGAVPAIQALRTRRDFALLVTHFSPSGRAGLEWLAPDHAGFPPLDGRAACERAIRAVRPDVLIFAKLDVWPGLAAAARRAGVPVVLINGVVRAGSRRLAPWARRAFRDTYAGIDAVGAATETDAGRLIELGARPDSLRVSGDASFDLAIARADRARRPGGARDRFETELPDRPAGGLRLVAGSTWPPDERALLEGLVGLREAGNARFAWQVVLVPHTASEAGVRRLVGECRARGQPVARWSRAEERARLPAHGIVVFDEVGRLAELYTAGDIAWVGGALGGSGLHNVLEPAAAGIPVLFGERHDRGDAAALVAAGGGKECAEGDVEAALRALAQPEDRKAMGARARAFVESRAGAGATAADLIESVWPRA